MPVDENRVGVPSSSARVRNVDERGVRGVTAAAPATPPLCRASWLARSRSFVRSMSGISNELGRPSAVDAASRQETVTDEHRSN